MPAKIYYDQDADLGLLKGKKVAIARGSKARVRKEEKLGKAPEVSQDPRIVGFAD